MRSSFPYCHQLDAMDCGPACLRMIALFYGKNYSLQTLRKSSFISRNGVSMLGISDAAESIGFRTSGVRISLDQLITDVPLPCILHWNQSHFVVCYGIKKKRGQFWFQIADPGKQLITYNEEELKKCWITTKEDEKNKGTALALEPGPNFHNYDGEVEQKGRSLSFFLRYLTPYKKELFQLMLGMLVISMLQLLLPFLAQALVDVGISNSNLNFITLVLAAQLIISVSQLSVEFIRSWILLHVNTRISIALISDFLAKLMKLPLHFFDTKMVGDIIQHIGDHNRIKTFLTDSSISTLFSFVSFFIFSIVLAYYNLTVLGIFLIGNSLYITWIFLFMKYCRELDIRRFAQAAGEQSNLIQIVTAMQEIKLNNCETQKRWQWERIQVKLFKISVRGLALGQVQQVGSVFFNQTTNIIISFIAAKAVVEGQMTLGMMMSLTYIIGQLSAPVASFIGFAQQFQDAKISLERLNEIHGNKELTEQKGVELFTGKRMQLGEIQSAYAAFITSLSEYVRFMELDYYTKKLRVQDKQLEGQRLYLQMANREFNLIEKDTRLTHSMYKRDSTLHMGNAMIAAEFEESESKYLQNLRSKENAQMSLMQTKIQLVQHEENLLDIRKQAYEEEHTYQTEFKNAIEQLIAQLSAWKQSYLLKSPIYCKVTFMTVWGRNQNVKSGETVFIVQPADSSKVMGKALLPLQGLGKVRIGQKVHIRLNNYPDQEFGYVKGEVRSISPAPTEEGMYVVEISLPTGLKTNYGNQLPVSQELKGTADIILADRNVLERLLAPIKKVIEYKE